MTTFTSDDREEEYKKILEKAPASPPHIVDSGASVMEMNANELADLIECACCAYQKEAAAMLRQQQAEIDRLNYDLDGFKQNFFVSGFHLQIKMANEQLLKQQEQIDALKSELDRAVELYTDKSIENEALEQQLKKEIQARADALDDLNNRMMKFMKSYNEMAWKLEEVGGAYTHPVKELTDEEIIACIDEIEPDTADMIRFARAIIRKARE